MLSKIMSKTKMMKNKSLNIETYDYWENTTDEEVVKTTLEYWKKISEVREYQFKVRDIVNLNNTEILNALFAEYYMGWEWSVKPVVFVDNFLPGGFLNNEKVVTNISHWLNKGLPSLLPDFTSDEYTLKTIDRLKRENIHYGLQPIAEGYEIYCDKHNVSIVGESLGEAVCKLALVSRLKK